MARTTLDIDSVRDRLDEILDEASQGSVFVIQREGKPLAAIIPYEQYEQLEKERQDAFRVFHETWEANKDADPDEVARIVEEEVEAYRGEKRERGNQREDS